MRVWGEPSGVHMCRPCDTCPYVTLETSVSLVSAGPGAVNGRTAQVLADGTQVSLRGRTAAGVHRGCARRRHESQKQSQDADNAEHVYRRRSSRAENALEVGSPFDITAVGEVGVEILDTFIGLQVTDGHGENVFRASKQLTVSSTSQQRGPLRLVAGRESCARPPQQDPRSDAGRVARFESSDVTFVPARLPRATFQNFTRSTLCNGGGQSKAE